MRLSDWQPSQKKLVHLCLSANNLASKDKFQESLQKYKECFAMFKRIYPNEMYRGISATYNDLANVCITFKKFELAKDYLDKSISINRKLFGSVSVELSTNFHTLGNLYSKEGKLSEAEKAYLQSLDIGKMAFGTEETTDSAITMYQMAILKLKKEDKKAAKNLLESSRDILAKLFKGREKASKSLMRVEKELERLKSLK